VARRRPVRISSLEDCSAAGTSAAPAVGTTTVNGDVTQTATGNIRSTSMPAMGGDCLQVTAGGPPARSS
jgi:hypothetical protein